MSAYTNRTNTANTAALDAIACHYNKLQEALNLPGGMPEKITAYAAFASLVGVALVPLYDDG